MKRRILCFVLTMAMVLSMLVVIPATVASADTYDASANPVLITTANDLKSFRNAVNGGNTFEGKVVKLCGNVDISDAAWTPIGRNGYQFRGSFDGQGYTITGMYQNYGKFTGDGGLFGYVQAPSTGGSIYIKNFKLTQKGSEQIKSSNGGYSAGTVISIIAPYPGQTGTVTVQNVYSSVSFDSSGALLIGVGGIVGNVVYNYGSTYASDDNDTIDGSLTVNIDSCQFAGSLGSPSAGSKRFGGILGYTGGVYFNKTINITNCSVTGEIHIWGSGALGNYDSNGGILGYLNGNKGTSGKTVNVNVSNNIFAGTMLWRKDSNQTGGVSDQGYIMGDFTSGKLGTVVFQNNYYVPSASQGGLTVTAGFGTSTSAATTVSNNVSKTMAELKAMTSGFEDNTKWEFGTSNDIPMPKSIYDTFFGTPSIFNDMSQSEFTITTTEEMAEFASLVNGGTTFAGKTIKLGADVALNTTVGSTSSYPFSGNFDGQGHTVTITQSLSNPDGLGGLFSMVRVPANSTVTIKNVHITGTIGVSGGAGFVGGLISSVDAGTSGNGGTLNVTNVWNTVRINLSSNSSHPSYNGGFIGFIRHADGLKPLTVTFESCYWDGTINAGGPLYHDGGFIGYTGNNKAGRTLTINISNSVANGTFQSNVDGWNQQFGMLVGYLRGGYTTNDATAKPTLNVSNVVSMGKATYANNTGSGSLIGVFDKIESIGELNVTNLYYTEFNHNGVSGDFQVVASGSITSGSATLKTKAQMIDLPASAFASSSKWNVSAGYPCPAGIVSTFGSVPSTLQATLYDVTDVFEIGTADALSALATDVNSGRTYEGKTVNLTGDIALDISWTSIGSRTAKPFRGTFNGQGHTITFGGHSVTADTTGALFAYLGNGAVVKNLKLDGTMSVSGGRNFIGALANAVVGTVNIQNCIVSTRINVSGNLNYSGLFVGFMENGTTSGQPYVGLTIDSCVSDGTINCGNMAKAISGFVGYSGNQASSTTNKDLTITNSIWKGKIMLNDPSYSTSVGGFLGYQVGSASYHTTVTIEDCVSAGTVTFDRNNKDWTGRDRLIAMVVGATCADVNAGVKQDDSGNSGPLTMTNVYYLRVKDWTGSAYLPRNYIHSNPAVAPVYTNTVQMTATEIYALTTASFTTAAKWNKTNGYYPCPASIVSTFGSVPESLEYAGEVTNIATVGELLALRDEVNSGTSFAGEAFKLTADIDLTGIEWQEIGLYSTAPFSGIFDGNGHTISNMTSAVSADATGALFGYVSNATIKNLTLTGRITTSGARNFIASVVNCASGDTTLQNVESSVYITQAANANAMNYTGGLVGFIHNTNSSNLTINGCTFSGTINTGGQTRSVAGILGYTGWGNSGVTKTVTITNTQFTGNINLNDTSYYCQNAGFIGYVKCAGGTITVNISNSYSDGKIYFNRNLAWTRSNNGECGQILGGVDSGVTLNIANTVSYRPAFLYTSVSSGTPVASSKVVLGELGSFGSNYSVDTAAVVEGMEIYAEKCTANSANAIRFVATIASASCSGGETQNATFGVYIMTKAMYDLFHGALTTANLDAASTTMITKVKALKCKNTSDGYIVSAVIYGFSTSAEKSGELVVIPYAGTRLGEAIITTYNSL